MPNVEASIAAAATLASIGATRKEGRLDGIVLALALGSATGMALVAGFLRLAVIIGATGCALGVAGLALQLRKRRETHASFGLAIIGIPSLAVGPMVARAYVVDDALPSGAFLIPALIPVLALGAGAIMPGRSPRVRGAIVILSSIVCAAALPLIVHGSSSNSESGDPYEQMYNEMMPSGEGNE